jgi:hypothetical protein
VPETLEQGFFILEKRFVNHKIIIQVRSNEVAMIDLIKEYLSLSEIALHNANLVYSIPALSGYYRPIARKVKAVDRERFLFEGGGTTGKVEGGAKQLLIYVQIMYNCSSA